MSQPYNHQIIWIIGASSGIGEALARELAGRGATLALSARRKDKLELLKDSLGTQHRLFALDITDAEVLGRTAQAIRAAFGRIDRAIFLSAAYTPLKLGELDLAITRQMIEVNLLGAFNLIHSLLPIFKEQGSGQIALTASVAGFIGLPGGQPYSATKAGIINLAESLRAELPATIDVKLINPGFVKTELTDKNDFNMPMIISAEKAAKNIADGLLKPSFEIDFPKRFTFLLKLLRLLPYKIMLTITKNIKEKP